MPISYRVDPARRRVETTITDEYTLADVEAYMDAVEADPAYAADFDRLIDLTATQTLLAPEEVRSLADIVRGRPASPRSRRALVAAGDAQFGVARMFELYAEDAPVAYRTFRDRAAADDWLAHARAAPDAPPDERRQKRRRYFLAPGVSFVHGGLTWRGGRVFEGAPSPDRPEDVVLLYHPSDPSRWVDVPASVVSEVGDSAILPWDRGVSGPPPAPGG